MALQSCPITKFVDDAVCYGMHKLSPVQQKALLIYALTLQLKAVGGKDYTTTNTSTLMTDATCLFKLNDDQRIAALINIRFVQAAAAGATVPATLALKLDVVKCLKTVPPERLDDLILFLTCLLGQNATQ